MVDHLCDIVIAVVRHPAGLASAAEAHD
jgi:hypothetical protein